MAPRTIDNPRHWHDRAAEIGVLAEEMTSSETRAMMLKLADDYDDLADRAQERSGGRATKSH